MNVQETDIVIIGLGPAGAAAAGAAALAGMRVTAIDRKRDAGQPVQCAEFVPALIGMEAGDLASSSIQSISEMITFVEGGAPDLTPNFPGKMIDRAAFDARLVDEAREAGAECRFGVKAVVSDDGVIHLSGGDAIHARMIIGADGVRSRVGNAMGSVNKEIVETRQLTALLNKSHQATDIFLSSDIPGGYGWMFPKGDLANIGLGVDLPHKEKLKPALEALHHQLVEEGRVGAEAISYTGGAIPVGGLIRAYGTVGKRPAFLAGDAAGLANPVTGAGIASAVMSGKLAGEAACAMLAGEGTAGEDYCEELEDLFGVALDRARRHRERLRRNALDTGGLSEKDLRSGWIAYPQYWAA